MILLIEQRRKAAMLTQTELAEAVGVSQSSVSQWESGITTPKTELLALIAKACGCKVGDFFEDAQEAKANGSNGD